ncbi:MAG: hypothetical protein P8Z75_13835 [Gammaproteobacteria bacterium]
MILSPRPVCPINVKVYQDQSNARDAGFSAHVISANKQEGIASK